MTNRWFRQGLVLVVIGCAAVAGTGCGLLGLSGQEDSSSRAQQGPYCTRAITVLDDANRAYETMDLLRTLAILEPCETAGWPQWTKDDRVDALRLMAIAYHYMNKEDQTTSAITNLLAVQPHYDRGREDPDFFWTEVFEMKRLRKAERWKKRVIFGGLSVAAAAAVLGFVLIPQLKGAPSLPGQPPPFPTGN